ncbi:MAG: hypothetical protein Q4C91_19140, partial [Eubacteriales bacterium]|nr:hypothetical protein [Eubacteriales bacterium]
QERRKEGMPSGMLKNMKNAFRKPLKAYPSEKALLVQRLYPVYFYMAFLLFRQPFIAKRHKGSAPQISCKFNPSG